MPSMILPSAQPPLGFGITKKEILIWNRTGATRAIGDLLLLDLFGSAAETTSFNTGDSTSAFANAIDSVATDRDNGTYLVCKEAAGDNELTEMVAWGLRVDVNVENNLAVAATAGTELWAPASANFDHLHAETTVPADSQRLGFFDAQQPDLGAGSTGLRRAGAFTGFHNFGIQAL